MKDAWEDCSVMAQADVLAYDQVRLHEEFPPPPKTKRAKK